MTDVATNLKDVMQNVERELEVAPPPAEVARFAPAKFRAQTLLQIQTDIRKTVNDLLEQKRRLDEYAASLKAAADELLRSAG